MVDKSGHILTNNHVVAGAIEIKVGLADDSQYEAELVGTDENTDLAVIKLKDCPAEKIVPAVIGDSNQLEVGQWVLTVGAPYGRTKSVSAGIVSATGRTHVIPDAMRESGKIYYENFIQTDAAINRGNSGGPLVNYQGEVVGINAAIETRTGDYAGVGFAIPSSMAKPVMDQLIARGKVVRGYLGVNIADITDAHVKDLNLSTREGVVVEQVNENTPAERAGVEPKDVIVAVNGKPALSVVQIQSVVSGTEPGTKIKLDVLRGGKTKTLEVVIDELPRKITTAEAKFADEEIGITVLQLTPELAQQSGYAGEKGLLVMSVVEGSPADKAGIKEKDLIKEVANASVVTVGDFTRARKGQSIEKGVLLLVKTGDKARLALVK
jgi:serine protease Do